MKPLNIEVVLKDISSKKWIIPLVENFLQNYNVRSNTIITEFDETVQAVLNTHVTAIIIEEVTDCDKAVDLSKYHIKWHLYTLDTHGSVSQIEENGENDEELSVATHLLLPSEESHGIWENLYYDNNIKENLLQYSQTMMEFSDRGVNSNIVSCNRVVLLHGPPGTGKTSLCKALAHKLAIRMQDRYSAGILIEINSQSLFSKWFSESGKLVTKLFGKIREIVENPELLVCVLIDEVESLAHARTQCQSGNEPSDSIRVVNALLTQIDQIKRHPNVLLLTTSNLTESIDLAFIDRADIKQYLGLPTPTAIYQVYASCLLELMRVQIIDAAPDLIQPVSLAYKSDVCGDKITAKIKGICEKSFGLSGRSLRKIPFIAHALYLNRPLVDIDVFMEAMISAIEREKTERSFFENVKMK